MTLWIMEHGVKCFHGLIERVDLFQWYTEYIISHHVVVCDTIKPSLSIKPVIKRITIALDIYFRISFSTQ